MIKKEFNAQVQKHLNEIEKDKMSVFLMADSKFRGAFFNGTTLVNQMRAQHNLGILETLILGHGVLCAALMIQTMKGKEHLTFRYDTDGLCKGFSVELDSTGYIRGYIYNNIEITEPPKNFDIAPYIGEGTVTITRYTEGAREPQIGTTQILYKNIALDLAHYFLQSEQINTAFNTSIQFDKEGNVIGAGGMFLQSIPEYGGKSSNGPSNSRKASSKIADADIESSEASSNTTSSSDCITSSDGTESNDEKLTKFAKNFKEELLIKAENAFRAMPSIGQWFAQKGNNDDVVYGLFREFEPKVVLERDIIFDCPCSKDSFLAHIKNLPKSQLQQIIEDKKDLEVICHNCNSIYTIPVSELM